MGWRVWFAFEERPGVIRGRHQDRRDTWRALAESCRQSDGRIDSCEYMRFLDVMVEHSHLWGEA